MPTYTYRCPVCMNSKDTKHKMSEDPVIHCTQCEGSPVMDRLVATTEVMRKGKNWPSKRGWDTH